MSRWFGFLILAAVAAIAAGWAASLFVPEASVPEQASTVDRSAVVHGDPTHTVSADPPVSAPAVTEDRFKLAGVVAEGGSGGVALIAVDGQPARGYRVGATVEGDIVVREVSALGATLGPREGGAAIALEAPLAQAPTSVTAPLAPEESALESNQPLNDGSAKAQQVLRKLGSKHPPLVPSTSPLPQKPGDAAPLEDDGRWPPPGG